MSTATAKEQATKVITGRVRASYLHVFEAVAVAEGQDKKFSVSLIIPKSDKSTIAAIKAAQQAAAEQGKTSKFGGKIPANLKTPLRDGDVERPEDEAYANSYFVNATCKTKPGIIDKSKEQITDPADFVSGDYCRASLTFYPFNTSGNKGIACGLNNLQKLADGEPLGGRSRAEDDFSDDMDGDDDDLI
jgi:hypothetical protein